MKKYIKELVIGRVEGAIDGFANEAKSQYTWTKFSVKLAFYTVIAFVVTLIISMGALVIHMCN